MAALDTNDTKNPPLFLVIFFAAFMVLVGALSGFILLASFSPKPFKSLAAYKRDLEENPKKSLLHAYYFKGSSSASDEWVEKRRTFLSESDTTVEFTDAEINAWIADEFEKTDPFSQKQDSKIYLTTGLPNVFIDADQGIYFNMLVEVICFGMKFDYLLIGQGSFPEEDPDEFSIDRLRLNEAAIPLPEDLLHEYVLGPVLKSFYQSVEFTESKDAWEKVDTVKLTENRIRLNLN